MIRKHKKFNKPKKSFDSERIKEENVIVKKYGLKNKREIWKAKAKLDNIRNLAKKLMDAELEKQEVFLNKLKKQGYNVEKTVDVLALTVDDVLKRRLQTIVLDKRIATQPKQARQLITHKHIIVGDNLVNIPSYHVNVEEENAIKRKEKKKVKKPVEEVKETLEESSEQKENTIETQSEENVEVKE